jgi:GWxTD domain-containing protein
VEARGDIHFHLDAARFLEDGTPKTEIYLSIPQAELVASPDSAGFAHLRIEIRFEDAHGDRLTTYREDSWVPMGQRPLSGREVQPRWLLIRRPEAPPETAGLMVRIEDQGHPKRGLLDRIRRKKAAGEASGRFLPGWPACGLSEIVFGWEVGHGAKGSEALIRGRMHPNPQRFYGLYQTTLLFYVESYGDASPLGYEIYQSGAEKLVASGVDGTGSPSQPVQPVFVRQDVSAFPAGAYRVEAWKVGADSCRTRGTFQVLWDTASWTRDQEDLLDEAYVLLGPTEYDRVREMSPGEAEAYLHDLWRRHDPNPSTGRNELRDIFDERVAHADNFFGTSFRKGMMTDRGRVYIRYGPPDEIEKELNPQDLDLLANVLPGEVASDRLDIIRKPMQRDSRDNRAYEIWYYQVRGAPLFPEQLNPVQRTGLKFIFVDELGYGDMRMIYTNLSGAF